jgi:hypothetical protein
VEAARRVSRSFPHSKAHLQAKHHTPLSPLSDKASVDWIIFLSLLIDFVLLHILLVFLSSYLLLLDRIPSIQGEILAALRPTTTFLPPSIAN